jgi:ribosomal protein L29
METARRLEELEQEIRSLKGMLLMERATLAEKKLTTLRGMGKLLVSEEELEAAIDNAKRSLFSGVKNALRD